VCCKNGIDQGGFSKTCLSCKRKLATGFLPRRREDRPTQMMLNWKPLLSSFRSIWFVMESKPT
jgi:hypothetical protein